MKRNVKCPVCGCDSWDGEYIYKLINPNGEYVEGYGHSRVTVVDKIKYRCASCNYEEGGNPTIIDIKGNVIGTIGKKD